MAMRATRAVALTAAAGLALAVPAAASTSDRPIYVRPGAPGEPTQRISPQELATAPAAVYTEAEVEFIQHMIVHHHQAVVMTDWAPQRASSDRLLTMAERMQMAQDGEIGQMSRWLRLRGEDVPDLDEYDWGHGGHDGHDDENGHDGENGHDDDHGDHDMPGMLTDEEMEQLEAAEGDEFDQLFLDFMIFHHKGAVTMINDLRDAQNNRLEPNVSAMASEMYDTQRSEINRMRALQTDLGH